jgi:glycosyltransferase involved in cell wall biosynthesis
MRVVFFVHCFFPSHFYGTETYTLELAKQYRAMGIDVHVVTAIFPGEPAADDLLTHYEFQGIPVTCIDKNRLPNTRVKDTYYQPDMRPILAQILRDLRPDVVHVTHLINHTAALLEVVRELAIPCYATFTDFFGFCFNNKLEAADGSLCAGPSPSRANCMACYLKDRSQHADAGRVLRWGADPDRAIWLARGMNLARRFPPFRGGSMDGLYEDLARRPETLQYLYSGLRGAVAASQFLRTAYERNGFAMKIAGIPFGVDIERHAKPSRPAGHRPVVGFIGQIARHKGTDILIEAFRRLPADAAALHIFGPADQDPAYMSSLHALTKDAPIRFRGTFPKEGMREVMDSLDLLVIPSRWYENSPLVLLNALATHTPVVVSDVAGMTEFVEEGISGFSFQRGSADDLARVLGEVVLEPDRLRRLSLTTHYERTPRIMAEETLAIYDRQTVSAVSIAG